MTNQPSEKVVKFDLAKQEVTWIHIAKVEKTNCTDKIKGHVYEWIFKDNPLHAEIKRQHPGLRLTIVRCTKCGKVSSSM